MSLAKFIAGDLTRPRVSFLCAVLAIWNAYAAYRLTLPLKAGHEAFIARQIGRTGRNHLVLGLSVTKGANVAMVRSDGSLDLHRSYSPLASWTAAVPMALGFDFDLSVRLPMLISSNLFLIGLWGLVAARWGTHPAELALLFGMFSPVFFFSYGLTCIFEILALGPLMIALALFAQPRRNGWIDALIALTSVAAAMYSWICWIAILPCLVREFRIGRRRAALINGAAILGVPLLVHFVLTGLASGNLLTDLKAFVDHIAERSSSKIHIGTTDVSYPAIIALGWERALLGIGLVPVVFTVAALVVVILRRRIPGAGWLIALFALGVPLNLARNIAYLHDFFIILFVPVAAVAAGTGTWWLAERFRSDRKRALVVVGVLTAYFSHDVAPRYRTIRAFPVDYQQAAIASAIGRHVQKDDFVIVNPAVCGTDSAFVATLPDFWREQSPRPFYCGQLSQTVYVAANSADADRIARWAKPGQRVVVLEVGEARFDLPSSFSMACEPSADTPLLVGIRGSGIAASRDSKTEAALRR